MWELLIDVVLVFLLWEMYKVLWELYGKWNYVGNERSVYEGYLEGFDI